ncbi:MAG: membrane protein insertion efficiency factor YidD [Deltaproteobacteria bacterium]|nr:membrane protein insertion efficiency factor YidD [Deltaproteobacteria bacterium]
MAQNSLTTGHFFHLWKRFSAAWRNLRPLERLMVSSIRLYQAVISPLIGPVCRFHPSCSEYAILAIQRHGAFKGLYLAVRRVLKCHPFNPGGFDPVP